MQTVNSTATPPAGIAPAVTFDDIVAQWEGGMTRMATYQKDKGCTRVHVARTERDTYWVLRYFQLGDNWVASADASNVDLPGVLQALEISFGERA